MRRPSPSAPKPFEPNFDFLAKLQRLGYQKIVGVDEVGRGALAGPICVGAVELTVPIIGINDSKQIPKLHRSRLAGEIHRQAVQIRFGWASNLEIDRLGLAPALSLAYQRALANIEADLILTDHYRLPDWLKHIKAVRGDSLFYPVAAASIVAKVCRDQLMTLYSHLYPHYRWGSNVGYGTLRHLDAISIHGPTNLHRHSFLG